MRNLAVATILLVLACVPATAIDLVNGKIARFRNEAGTSRDKATIKFVREAFVIPPLPSPLCPEGASFSIVTDTQIFGPVALDCSLWSARSTGFLYRDSDGTAGGVEKILFKQSATGGKLIFKLADDNYGAAAIGGPAAFVEVRLDIGATTYCGRFQSPPSQFTDNDPDRLSIKGPSAACQGAAPTATANGSTTATATETPASSASITATATTTRSATATSTATRTPTGAATATATRTHTTTPVATQECRNAGFCVTVPPGNDLWNQVGSAADVQGACDIDYVATTALDADGHSTEYLDCTNFGFAVPDGSTILGITTRWTRGKSNVTRLLVDLESRVVKNDVHGAANKADTATNWCQNCLSTATYGGASDLWSDAWSPADIRNSGFGASLRAQRLAGGTGTLNAAADCVQICVDYAVGATPTTTATGTPTYTPTPTATGGATSTATATIGGVLSRPADPVVMTGADVSSLTGISPNLVVGFRYSGGWSQIPVQVDERATINFNNVYNNVGGYGANYSRLDYTDAGTFAGADANSNFDSDDEIVFMARDSGNPPPVFSEPAGVVSGTGLQVQVTDPLGGTGYVYLFRHDGSLSPDAGQSYVSYSFSLSSGPYLTTYSIGSGPNPENSSITTAHYSSHFTDRWAHDRMQIFSGGASGVDFLDRHKALFGPGVCSRSEDTFSSGEGAFIINKNGPIRGVRSYVGANSGPRTQRQHLFYDRRQDITTHLRVHAIPGIMDFFDYSPAASGMIYRNTNNTAGVTIDGNPETPTAGVFDWELVTGAQGSLTHVGALQTDVTITNLQFYYLDDSTPPVTQCTGDAFAYGSSGMWINQGIPNTDPASPPFSLLAAQRAIYYDAPGLGVTDAQQRRDWYANPLTFSISAW